MASKDGDTQHAPGVPACSLSPWRCATSPRSWRVRPARASSTARQWRCRCSRARPPLRWHGRSTSALHTWMRGAPRWPCSRFWRYGRKWNLSCRRVWRSRLTPLGVVIQIPGRGASHDFVGQWSAVEADLSPESPTGRHDPVMHLNVRPTLSTDLRPVECDFWDGARP